MVLVCTAALQKRMMRIHDDNVHARAVIFSAISCEYINICYRFKAGHVPVPTYLFLCMIM